MGGGRVEENWSNWGERERRLEGEGERRGEGIFLLVGYPDVKIRVNGPNLEDQGLPPGTLLHQWF